MVAAESGRPGYVGLDASSRLGDTSGKSMIAKSEQEQVIQELSSVLLGAQWVFKPDNYGNTDNEPADLVWWRTDAPSSCT
jgi:hypothetical protein